MRMKKGWSEMRWKGDEKSRLSRSEMQTDGLKMWLGIKRGGNEETRGVIEPSSGGLVG